MRRHCQCSATKKSYKDITHQRSNCIQTWMPVALISPWIDVDWIVFAIDSNTWNHSHLQFVTLKEGQVWSRANQDNSKRGPDDDVAFDAITAKQNLTI